MNFNRKNILKVSIPSEHGSWGLFLEPIILSLVIACTTDGLLLSLCAFLLFLANQPSSFIIKQNPKFLLGLSYVFLILYLLLAGSILIFLIILSPSIYFLFPFFVAVLLMLIFKIFELFEYGRNVLVELLPQVSLALIASSILLRADWQLYQLLAFNLILLSRSVQTVFYINNKLKLFKGYTPNIFLVNSIGLLFLFLLIGLFLIDLVPLLSIIAILGLMLRAHIGLKEKNKSEKVIEVGIKEFIYGFLFVTIISIGYIFTI